MFERPDNTNVVLHTNCRRMGDHGLRNTDGSHIRHALLRSATSTSGSNFGSRDGTLMKSNCLRGVLIDVKVMRKQCGLEGRMSG